MWEDIKKAFKLKVFIKRRLRTIDAGVKDEEAARLRAEIDQEIEKAGLGNGARMNIQEYVDVTFTRRGY